MLLLLCAVYNLVRKHPLLLNRLLLTQGWLMFLNSIVENVTTLPSSSGRHASCKGIARSSGFRAIRTEGVVEAAANGRPKSSAS